MRVCTQVEHILAEKSTLEQVDNPGFVNLYGSFQDEECIYLAMEFVPGGEFFSHLKARKRCADQRVTRIPQKTRLTKVSACPGCFKVKPSLIELILTSVEQRAPPHPDHTLKLQP